MTTTSIPAVSRPVRHGGRVIITIAEQGQVAGNALFHPAAWIARGDDAPGAATEIASGSHLDRAEIRKVRH
jgi:hypothetical protein